MLNLENIEQLMLLRELEVKYNVKDRKKLNVHSSKDAYKQFKVLFDNDMGLDMIESFFALYLSRSNNVIGWIKISQGGVYGTVADSKLIFGYALKCLASSIIIAHNHPSGNLKPSQADLHLTETIRKAGKLLEINLIDHLILSDDGFYSFVDEGLL
jgi:DNA repair protein RadC